MEKGSKGSDEIDSEAVTQITPLLKPSETNVGRGLLQVAMGEPASGPIPGYELGEVLGEGGFGTVYQAYQFGAIEREVALKLIKPGMASPEVILRFEAERQALALMDHPNIAKVYDAGSTEDGRPFFAMELVKGEPLAKFCDRKKLSISERIRLLQDVLAGIEHAHRKAILHRDLKPSNILVEEIDGVAVPKIIDFGIAKALQDPLGEQTLVTMPGMAMGTPRYMSPEQFGAVKGGVDTRSDVYALGVVLYELISGTTPLARNLMKDEGVAGLDRALRAGADSIEKRLVSLRDDGRIEEIATDRGLSGRFLQKRISGDLAAIITRALEVDPEERYQSVGDFSDDLDRYLSHSPVEARSTTGLYRLRKFTQRNRLALAVGAVIAGILILGSVVSIWQAVRATRYANEADDERRNAEYQLGAARSVSMLQNRPVEALALASKTARDEIRNRGEVSAAVSHALSSSVHHGLRYWSDTGAFGIGADCKGITIIEELGGIVFYVGDGLKFFDIATRTLHRLPLESAVSAVSKGSSKGELLLGFADGVVGRVAISESLSIEIESQWQASAERIVAIQEARDGRIVTVGSDAEVAIWSTEGVRVGGGSAEVDGRIGLVEISSLGDSVVMAVSGNAGSSGSHLLRTEGGKQIGVISGGEGWVTTVAIHPDSGEILTGGSDSIVRRWDRFGEPLGTPLPGHRGEVHQVAWGEGGVWASGDDRGFVRVMRHPGDDEGMMISANPKPIRFLEFMDNGRTLCVVGQEGAISFWDVTGLESRRPLFLDGSTARGLKFSSGGDRIACTSDDGMLRIFAYPSGQKLHEARTHAAASRTLLTSTDGKLLIVGSNVSGEVALYDWDAKVVGRVETSLNTIYTGAVLAGGNLVGLIGDERIAWIDVVAQRELRTGIKRGFFSHGNHLSCISPEAMLVQNPSQLRSLGDGSELPYQTDMQRLGNLLLPFGDGTYLISGTTQSKRVLRRFDLATDRVISEVEVPLTKRLWCGAYHAPSGKVALGDHDGFMTVVDRNLAPIFPIVRSHPQGLLLALDFHPSGNIIASSGDDGEIRFWHSSIPSWLSIASARAEGWPLPSEEQLQNASRTFEVEASSSLKALEGRIPDGWEEVSELTMGAIRLAQKGRLGRDRSRAEALGALRYANGGKFDFFDTPFVFVIAVPEVQGEAALAERFAGMMIVLQYRIASSFSSIMKGCDIVNPRWDESRQLFVASGNIDLVNGGEIKGEIVYVPRGGDAVLYFVSAGGSSTPEARLSEVRDKLGEASISADRTPAQISRSKAIYTGLATKINANSLAKSIQPILTEIFDTVKAEQFDDVDVLKEQFEFQLRAKLDDGFAPEQILRHRIQQLLAEINQLRLGGHHQRGLQEAEEGAAILFSSDGREVAQQADNETREMLVRLCTMYNAFLRPVDSDIASEQRWAERWIWSIEQMDSLNQSEEDMLYHLFRAVIAYAQTSTVLKEFDHAEAALVKIDAVFKTEGREMIDYPQSYRSYLDRVALLRSWQEDAPAAVKAAEERLRFSIRAFEGEFRAAKEMSDQWKLNGLSNAARGYRDTCLKFPAESHDRSLYERGKALSDSAGGIDLVEWEDRLATEEGGGSEDDN